MVLLLVFMQLTRDLFAIAISSWFQPFWFYRADRQTTDIITHGQNLRCDDDNAGTGETHSTEHNSSAVWSHEGKECHTLHRPARGRRTGGRVFLQGPRPVATVVAIQD